MKPQVLESERTRSKTAYKRYSCRSRQGTCFFIFFILFLQRNTHHLTAQSSKAAMRHMEWQECGLTVSIVFTKMCTCTTQFSTWGGSIIIIIIIIYSSFTREFPTGVSAFLQGTLGII